MRARQRRKKEYRAYVEQFVFEHRDKTPEEVVQHLAKKALGTIEHIREEGIKEENRLKAARYLLDRVLPQKQHTEHEHKGKIDFNAIEIRFVDSSEPETGKD